MAAEDGHVILNPYADQGVNKDAVARNEALRLYLRDKNITPDFNVTDDQRAAFAGTVYGADENALKATIAARIYSGDPSAKATEQQSMWVHRLFNPMKPIEDILKR
jgi:GH24 family phage-related lysozyme (muramidase)